MANKTYVAYCGGKMGCDGYITPRKSNISNITAGNGADWTNISGINETDGDAFVFETNENGGELKLHIFRTSCSPIMSCTYNGGSGAIINNSTNIWKKSIDGNLVMVDYNGGRRISATTNSSANVEFSFINDNGDIPSETNNSMFAGCSKLIRCDIPCQMNFISYATFADCTSLEEYSSNPDTIDTIGESAFSGCTSLRTLKIGKYAVISEKSFFGCNGAYRIDWCGLRSDEVKCRMTSIPQNAFAQCNNIAETVFKDTSFNGIYIPYGITSINDYAFYYCSSASEVTLNNVASVSDAAFLNCTSVDTVNGIENLINIGNNAFGMCPINHSITLGEDCFVKLGAFRGCRIPVLNISDGVTLSNNSFSGDTSLTSVTVNGDFTATTSSFSGCSGLREVTLSSDVTNTANAGGCFSHVSGLKIYAMSSSVITDLDSAFNDADDELEIYVPSNLTTAYHDAYPDFSWTIHSLP